MPATETPEPAAGVRLPTVGALAAPPPSPRGRRRRPLLWLAMLLIAGAATWWLVHFVHRAVTFETTDDAYIRTHVHLVSTRLAGTVQEVLVGENEKVQAGQVLARIDPTEFEIALEKARAALAQARAEELQSKSAITRAQAQIAQSQAMVKQAEAQVGQMNAEREVASVNFGRNQRLFQSDARAVSKAEIDATRSTAASTGAALEAARANVDAAQSQAQAAQAGVETAQAQLEAAQAGVRVQEAAVRDAERELSYAEVKAPSAGQIGSKNVEVGNRVQVGQALFAIVEPHGWIMANFKETQLKKMRPGQPVEITIDAVDGRTFQGRLESFSPATGAQFALLPPDNATGNFTKVVQRVPVKITFDPESIRGVEDRLSAGLSAVVHVKLR